MNNGGWGLKDMLLMVAVLAIALFISVTIYDKTFGEGGVGEYVIDNLSSDTITSSKNNYTSNISYSDIEANMVKASKNYITDNDIILLEDDTLVISLDKLVNNNYMDKVTIDNNKCSGYVVINNTYSAYLKCSNYKTLGYDQSFDK